MYVTMRRAEFCVNNKVGRHNAHNMILLKRLAVHYNARREFYVKGQVLHHRTVLTIVRIVKINYLPPTIISDDVNDSLMVIWPHANSIVEETGGRCQHLKEGSILCHNLEAAYKIYNFRHKDICAMYLSHSL